MTRLFTRLAISICLLWAGAAAAMAQNATPKYKMNFPPSADLRYTITAQQKGIPLEGEANVRWTASANNFSVSSETRASLFGKVLETKSEGAIDDHGLAPAVFTEKRLRRDATTTTFDRNAKTIRFSTSDATYPIKGGEQDRSSVLWQLIAAARATPAKFKAGSEWHFVVAGERDTDPWTFKVVKQEKIQTPNGALNAVHVLRSPSSGGGQKLDIWLAPSMEWYPVKLRFSEQDADFIEQTLSKVDKKSS